MSYPAVVLARNPIAYWPLEGETTSVIDATGHGYLGTPTLPLSAGSVPFTTSGPSTYFTGGATRVFIGATDLVWPMSRFPAAGQPFSVEYRVRSATLFAQEFNFWHKTGNDVLACYGPISGGATVALSGITPNWRLNVNVDSTPRDQWHYIVNTYDGTALKMYVNCTLAGISTFVTSFGSTVASDGLWFGQQMTADFEVAHVAIYDYPLTAGDVATSCLAAAAEPARLRFTYAPGGGTHRWTIPAGRTTRITYSD